MAWVSVLVCKRLDIRPVLEVHFGCKSVWLPRHKRTTYKLIFGVVIVLKYYILNLKSFGDHLVWVSILVRKRLDCVMFWRFNTAAKDLGT